MGKNPNTTCETCHGEGGITTDHFGDTRSFECPDCNGTGGKIETTK